MLRRFFPKQENFFLLFDQLGEILVESSLEFKFLVDDPSQRELRCNHLKEWEHKADNITHQAYDLLHTTFITPFDREDIYKLVSGLDDIVDLLEAASQRFFLYDLAKSTPEIKELTQIAIQQIKLVQKVLNLLQNLKDSGPIRKHCIEINRLENDADQVYRKALAQLFKDENDIKTLIKLKDIYFLLESVTDSCEKVANLVDGIVLDYA